MVPAVKAAREEARVVREADPAWAAAVDPAAAKALREEAGDPAAVAEAAGPAAVLDPVAGRVEGPAVGLTRAEAVPRCPEAREVADANRQKRMDS